MFSNVYRYKRPLTAHYTHVHITASAWLPARRELQEQLLGLFGSALARASPRHTQRPANTLSERDRSAALGGWGLCSHMNSMR